MILKKAFTLAEVLITLGVLGVVAAMVMPTLMSEFQERVWITRLKHTAAVLSQAYLMASKDHGVSAEWNHSGSNQERARRYYDYLKDYIQKPLISNTRFTYTIYDLHGNQTSLGMQQRTQFGFVLNNGTIISIMATASNGHTDDNGNYHEYGENHYFVGLVVDVNGQQRPNILGKDIFLLFFEPNKVVIEGYDLWWVTRRSCSLTEKDAWHAGGACATWVLKMGNMDYLHRELTTEEWDSIKVGN